MPRYLCNSAGPIRLPVARTLLLLVAGTWCLGPQLAWGQFNPRGPGMPQFRDKDESEQRSARIPYYAPQSETMVQEVTIVGNRSTPTAKIQGMLQTRTNRVYDPELAQADVRRLISSKMFHDVRHYKRDVPGGVAVTFEVFERASVSYVRFVGNDDIKDKNLLKEVGIQEGDALHRFTVEEGRRRLEEMYHNKGYSRAHVSILEGLQPNDAGVVFKIHEGPRQRIYKTKIVGNTIDSDARLRTKIKSKPGILWYFGGKVDSQQMQEDVDRLRDYYHSLGFFLVRIDPKIEFNESQKWATVTFVVDEGPRYRVRNVYVNGSRKYDSAELIGKMELHTGDYFNLASLQTDLNELRDLYGSQGHIFADIQANPRFLGESGELDLVYNIDEGQQYRVGRIFVNIDGDESHTRHSVVLNRLSIKPGDIVDVREIRSSERRLQASQLFETNPTQGALPRIVVKPDESGRSLAAQPESAGDARIRGQSTQRFRLPLDPPVVDLHIHGKLR